MSLFDVVIRGGLVVDGTGSEPRVAGVAVAGGVVVEVGRVGGKSRRSLDADGLRELTEARPGKLVRSPVAARAGLDTNGLSTRPYPTSSRSSRNAHQASAARVAAASNSPGSPATSASASRNHSSWRSSTTAWCSQNETAPVSRP